MDFETYLRNKKIDPVTFQKQEPMRWHEFKTIFDQVHPDSFTAQKLFLINSIRRKYSFHEEPERKDDTTPSEKEKTTVKPVNPKIPQSASGAKPKMTPKVKISHKAKKEE